MHLTVIAKAPVAGRVKTRLCPPCTSEQAAQLAAAALHDTLDAVVAAVAGSTIRPVLLIDGEPPRWVPREFDIEDQCDGTLADRLADGFERLGRGAIVGMETPHAVHHLGRAMPLLDDGRDLLGPATDGGYWCIGLTRVDSRVFSDIEMSTSSTGDRQLMRLRSLGRTVGLLPQARDIDVFDDVCALARTGSPGRAVRVARRLVTEIDRRPARPRDSTHV